MSKHPIVKAVAKNLRKARLAKHLTQAQVAKKAAISSNHYARIERGEAIPSILTLSVLVRSLKTDSSQILPF